MQKFIMIFFSFAFSFAFSLNDLQNNLNHKNIDGNFTQIKYIKDFPSPFKSSGKFAIKGQNELYWDVLSPIENKIKISKNGIFIWQNEKWEKVEENVDKSIFLELFSLDENRINDLFSYKLDGNKNNWILSLYPKNFIMKKVFNDIKINGGDFIKSFDINETSGDFSHIKFKVLKTK